MKRKQLVVGAVLRGLLLVAFVSIQSISLVWFITIYLNAQRSIAELKDEQYASDKQLLKAEVEKALEYVDYYRLQTVDRLRQTIKSRALEAYSVAENIYLLHGSQLSDAAVTALIVDSLRPIRFGDDHGYYFITGLDGECILFPDKPELEGTNICEMQAADGSFVINDLIELAETQGEGYYEYMWTKPDVEGNDHRKIAYIKCVPPLRLYVGTGEYLEDAEKQVQSEVLEWIDSVAFGEDGYVFGGTYDGVSLSGPAKGQNMLHVEDVNGVKIVQELIVAARSGGGYVEYTLPPFEGLVSAPKLSYAAAVPEWQWYIGAGMYVSDIEQTIAARRSEIRRQFLLSISIVGLIVALLALLSFGVSLSIHRRIKNSLSAFFDFFKEARHQTVHLDPDRQVFQEFAELAVDANRMIDERDTAERELLKSKELYRLLVETMVEGLILTDAEENILFANSAAAVIMGVESGDLTNRHFSEFTSPAEYAIIQEQTQKRRHGETGRYDLQIQRPTGETRTIQISVTPQFDESSSFTGSLGTFHDITERLKLEQQLLQAQKMEALGTLAGGIAHDFNNVLFAILGYGDMLVEETSAGSLAREYTGEILKGGRRAADLVRQILSFARQTDVEREVLAVGPIIVEAVKLIRSTAPANIETRFELPEADLLVYGNATQLHQVLVNLCTNACHAMIPAGGLLNISLDVFEKDDDGRLYLGLTHGQYVRVTVADTGHGMDQAVLERIFDPFFTTKLMSEGTGMGLSVVHGIVTDMDGDVFVESKPGQGSSFTVLLPVAESQDRQATATSPEVQAGCERILVVDDEQTIVTMIARILEHLGYRVTGLTSSAAALQAFVLEPAAFDAVITDQDMPVMSGGQLASRLLEVRPDIPIILCTGYSNVLQPEDASRLGIREYLHKPLSRQSLTDAVRRVIDGNAARHHEPL